MLILGYSLFQPPYLRFHLFYEDFVEVTLPKGATPGGSSFTISQKGHHMRGTKKFVHGHGTTATGGGLAGWLTGFG